MLWYSVRYIDIVLGCYGIHCMLVDIALGLPEESSLLDTEVNRFSLTLAVWTKFSETTLLQ